MILMLLILTDVKTYSVNREAVTAIPANDFLNSIGVNSSINTRGETISQTLLCAEYLGFRWIRSVVPDGLNVRPIHIQWLLQRNVKISCAIGAGTTIADINNFVTGAKTVAGLGSLIALEGPNEPNNWQVTYNGVTGWKSCAQWQRDMYAAVKADPVLKDYPVWHLSEGGAETLNYGLQYLSIPIGAKAQMPDGTKYSDVACCHNYFAHPNWPAIQDNQTWVASDPSSACKVDGLYGNYGKTWATGALGYTDEQLLTLPRVTTETGINLGGVVTEQIQGLMYLSTYLSQYKRGWSYTAMYILRDRSDETGNQTFGFYKPDYTPRLAATYLHNLTSILADNISIKSPVQFTYTISPARPETVHELLLQKANGTLMLVVWSEKFKGGSDNIDVQFDNPLDVVNVYDPTVGIEPVQKFSGATSVSLVMTNHPYILEINPVINSVKTVNNGNESLAIVYPNPVENFLFIKNTYIIKKAELFDLAGKRELQLFDIQVGQRFLDMAHLAKGSYLLRLTYQSNKVENHKITKL